MNVCPIPVQWDDAADKINPSQEAKNRPNIDWQEKIHRGILRESHEIFLRPRKTRV
jgi:hypothetical protein